MNKDLFQFLRDKHKENLTTLYQRDYTTPVRQTSLVTSQIGQSPPKQPDQSESLSKSLLRKNTPKSNDLTPIKVRKLGNGSLSKNREKMSGQKVINSGLVQSSLDVSITEQQLATERAQRAEKQREETLRSLEQLQPKKFLRTKLGDLFQNHSDRCIGCYICLNNDNKTLISYKYPKEMKSDYNLHYLQFGSDRKAKPDSFNYDQQRQRFKIPFNPKQDYSTINQVTYRPYKIEPIDSARLKDPNQSSHADNPSLSNPFLGSTTYGMNYPSWASPQKQGEKSGRMEYSPTQKPADNSLYGVNGKAKLDDSTTYKQTFGKAKLDNEAVKNQKRQAKLYLDHNWRGNFQQLEGIPFQGKSTMQEAYQQTGLQKDDKFLPADNLQVDQQMHMVGQTEYQDKLDRKSFVRCKYLLTRLHKPL